MSREEEAIPCTMSEDDKAWYAVWACTRTAPADLSKAVEGLRAMPPCNERYTLADTIWWDIVDRAPEHVVEAVRRFRPPSKWRVPRYSQRRQQAIRNTLESWGWKFAERQPTKETDDD